jgi:hypothetical protein
VLASRTEPSLLGNVVLLRLARWVGLRLSPMGVVRGIKVSTAKGAIQRIGLRGLRPLLREATASRV